MAPVSALLRWSRGNEPGRDEREDRPQAQGARSVKTNAEDDPPVYAARAIFPHVAGREIRINARKVLGIRFFTTDLPQDFGLRSIFGRLPRPQ
ncbi:MAG: hypothetical protein M3272_02105 [Actinomycetota bacterium]|nr:hypothetical protein [Actinomycetota bacterium]